MSLPSAPLYTYCVSKLWLNMNVVYGLEFLLLCSYPHQYLVIFHTILITAFNLKDAVAWLIQHWQFS